MTDDPLTPMAESAAQVHELFQSYVNAGFTRAEALTIICAVLASTISGHRQ